MDEGPYRTPQQPTPAKEDLLRCVCGVERCDYSAMHEQEAAYAYEVWEKGLETDE